MGRPSEHGDIDPALVRHVYDVPRIAESPGTSLEDARFIFPQLVQNDPDEFAGQNSEFDADPASVLKRTLVAAKTNGKLDEQWTKHLMPLVYDIEPPFFQRAFTVFKQVASDFLAAC